MIINTSARALLFIVILTAFTALGQSAGAPESDALSTLPAIEPEVPGSTATLDMQHLAALTAFAVELSSEDLMKRARFHRYHSKKPKASLSAVYLYTIAAERGFGEAQSELAGYHLNFGVANLSEALKWSRRAADSGRKPGPLTLWSIHDGINSAAVPTSVKEQFSADDVAWLERQLFPDQTLGPTMSIELAQCREDAERNITRCWTELEGCVAGGCSYGVSCDKHTSSCDDHTSGPYGESGYFFCDTRDMKNIDFDREVVIRDACSHISGR